jgi:hypothetical protein
MSVVYHRTRMRIGAQRALYFTNRLLVLPLLFLVFHASLRTNDVSKRAGKHVSGPMPRLQNGLFLERWRYRAEWSVAKLSLLQGKP